MKPAITTGACECDKRSVTIQWRDIYGVPRAYPVDDQAKLFLKIIGGARTTISMEHLRLIKQLGFEIKQKGVEHAI